MRRVLCCSSHHAWAHSDWALILCLLWQQWPLQLTQLSLFLRLMISARTRRERQPEQISNQPDNIQNTQNIKIGDNFISGWPPRDSSSQLVTRRSFYRASSRHLWWICWWRVICVCRVGGRGWWEGWFTLRWTALPHGAAEFESSWWFCWDEIMFSSVSFDEIYIDRVIVQGTVREFSRQSCRNYALTRLCRPTTQFN